MPREVEYTYKDAKICLYTSNRPYVAVLTKSFLYIILPHAEALWHIFDGWFREVYWNHSEGLITISLCKLTDDENLNVHTCKEVGTYRSNDPRMRHVLKQFEEIVQLLLDKYAVEHWEVGQVKAVYQS